VLQNGERVPLDLPPASPDRLGLRRPGRRRQPEPILAETLRNLYDGVPIEEVQGRHPGRPHADRERARLHLRHRAPAAAHHRAGGAGRGSGPAELAGAYAEYFPASSRGRRARAAGRRLLQFDLARLGAALKPERDLQFDYLGLQTLYDRYFLHVRKRASSCRRPSSCAWPWAWR
jgi:ribonucleoside-diphosphate reductase alpha chain